MNGWLVDRFGSAKIIILSSLLGTAGALISAFAPSLHWVSFGYGFLIGNVKIIKLICYGSHTLLFAGVFSCCQFVTCHPSGGG